MASESDRGRSTDRPGSDGGPPPERRPDAASEAGTADPARDVSRRRLLAVLGASALPAAGSATRLTTGGGTRTDVSTGTLHARVYPGPVTAPARLGAALAGSPGGLHPAQRDAVAAVRDALGQVAAVAAERGGLDGVDVSVDVGAPVDLPFVARLLAAGWPPQESYTRTAVLDGFREELHERGVADGSACHLLLWWNPLNYAVGYGGTRAGTSHVAAVDGEGAYAVANVGATEFWDSRAVTRNIAIHEALHTFLEPDVVEAVVGSRCDHHLGSAAREADGTMRVSPMATAYAGPEAFDGATRFPGTGCVDRDAFSRHDGVEEVEGWVHTATLSDATLEAVTRYVAEHLA